MTAKYAGVSYDLFAGTPLYKPREFPAVRFTLGFQMMAQFQAGGACQAQKRRVHEMTNELQEA